LLALRAAVILAVFLGDFLPSNAPCADAVDGVWWGTLHRVLVSDVDESLRFGVGFRFRVLV